jgi:signal transduction histidine kinase
MTMKILQSQSIRKKLIFLFTATASLTVLIACTVLWVYQFVDYRMTLRTEVSAIAQLVADSSAPALLFNDAAAGNENLSLLRADPRIEAACLYDKRGKAVARFSPENKMLDCPASSPAGMQFTRKRLVVFRPIQIQGETVGNLYLGVSLAEMYRLLLRFAEIVMCVLLLTSIFALGLSSFLQRIISGPILALTRVATHVSDQGNYLLRAQRFSNDETGVLIDQFNAMMDRVQQREADLQQAHASLEDKVNMRTLDLSNEIAERKVIERDLVEAKVAAEESNRAKSAFLANMSHELRTPLNAIIGYCEMLYEDAKIARDIATGEDLSKILSSARQLLRLIADLLDFSKIEAGQMKIDLELVPVSHLLNDVVSTAQILAQQNHNELHLVQPVWDGMLRVDPFRFRQCLLNLLSNSCKFTKNGRISIAVSEKCIEGKNWIQWSVRDTGIGISAAGCKKLFQTFSQVDESNTRKYGGTGLGLAISQQLCHAMGGHITVESETNIGSTFTIHIPAYVRMQ